MARILYITFPNGEMRINCSKFFPCQQQYIRMLDKVISLNNDPNDVRDWVIKHIEERINTEHNDKVKAKLKKNCEFMRSRYAKTSHAM